MKRFSFNFMAGNSIILNLMDGKLDFQNKYNYQIIESLRTL